MEVIVTIPPSVEEHLRTYTASLFLETSPYAISRAVLCALVNQLDAACVVSRDEIVAGILAANLPPVAALQSTPEPTATLLQKEAPPLAVDVAPATPSTITISDPKKLKVPGERFQGKPSNTWLVWGWCMSSSLNLVTPDSGARKFHSFNLQDVIQGVLQKKGTRIKDTTAYSALSVMTDRQWLNFNTTSKLYSLTPVAQRWALTPKNQSYLIDKGFLDPIAQGDQIIK